MQCCPSITAGSILCLSVATACGAADLDADRRARGTPLVTTAVQSPQFVQAAHGGYAVKLEWLSGAPKVQEEGSARLSFLNAKGNAPREATVAEASLWMPAHGHGSVVEPQVNQVAAQPPDVVEVTSIVVQMSGAWELRIDATVDGERDTAALPFDVP